MNELKYKLEKLDLKGTKDKKEIVVLKFLQGGEINEIMSLKQEISDLKEEADWENVCIIMLPAHIHLAKLSDEDLDSLGLVRK